MRCTAHVGDMEVRRCQIGRTHEAGFQMACDARLIDWTSVATFQHDSTPTVGAHGHGHVLRTTCRRRRSVEIMGKRRTSNAPARIALWQHGREQGKHRTRRNRHGQGRSESNLLARPKTRLQGWALGVCTVDTQPWKRPCPKTLLKSPQSLRFDLSLCGGHYLLLTHLQLYSSVDCLVHTSRAEACWMLFAYDDEAGRTPSLLLDRDLRARGGRLHHHGDGRAVIHR